MLNKDIQYINIIKTQNNIKIENQIFQNNQLKDEEQSIFLLDNDNISNDTIFKLQTLEHNIPLTYTTAIYEDEQYIVNNDQTTLDTKIIFDHSHHITAPTQKIEQTKQFYNNSKIDYLISPYSILNNLIHTNLKENSLNLLILNNTIYTIILDKDKRYCYSVIKHLTSFEDIKQSSFYNDEIVEQKLYDEIYNLELNEIITDITKDFYDKNNSDTFIETINIFYHIKQLNDEQLKNLTDTLMLDITYTQIDLNKILFEMVQKPNINKQSFIQPRKKKSPFSFFAWSIIALFSTFVAGFIFYYFQTPNKEDNNKIKELKKITKTIKQPIKIKEIALPNHITNNAYIISNIKNIFNTISDNEVLKEIQLQQNESTLVYTFTNENSYEKYLKPRLLKLYNNSENVLSSRNNSIFSAIVSNSDIINKYKPTFKIYKQDKNSKNFDTNSSYTLIKSFLNNKTTIKKLSTTKTKYTTISYKVLSIVNTPQEFFDIIEKINKTNYSILLSYPIEFSKSKQGLSINFILKFNILVLLTNKR